MDALFSSDLWLWASRYVLGLVVVVAWFVVIRKWIFPIWRRSKSGGENTVSPTSLLLATVVAATITVVAYWFITLQPIATTTTVPDRTLERQRANAAEERLEDAPTVAPDTRETLAERAKRVEEEDAAQNQRAKDEFKALKKP